MKITVNHQPIEVDEGMTIWQACNSIGINIPSLCYFKDISANASCGVCVVEVKGVQTLLRSCITEVTEGMEIITDSPRVREARKVNVELLLANHPEDCLQCDRNLNCELQQLAFNLGIHEKRFVRTRKEHVNKDETSLSLVRDPEKCILCGRCVAVCEQIQSVKAIDFSGRGLKTKISTCWDTDWEFNMHQLWSMRLNMPYGSYYRKKRHKRSVGRTSRSGKSSRGTNGSRRTRRNW